MGIIPAVMILNSGKIKSSIISKRMKTRNTYNNLGRDNYKTPYKDLVQPLLRIFQLLSSIR
jgi:hypothetical protein